MERSLPVINRPLTCKFMQIHSAQFVKSSSKAEECPEVAIPEYAFIGRSNVGKSSLINMITGRKNLALTGNTPGKTMLINHFLINNKWFLVDLPGYGYAKRSKTQRDTFNLLIKGYLYERHQLTNLFILIDSRLEPQAIDLLFIQEMGEIGVPFSLIFTKIDKLSKTQLDRSLAIYRSKLLEDWEELPPIFKVSSVTREGREDLITYIEHINQEQKK